jgi:peptide-methionine (S)-S-oxide reductase
MTETTPVELETAILAGGCFWCTEAIFSDVEGVRRVEPGYIGGSKASPTYEEVCGGGTGHAEAVRISFDPQLITYRDLLLIFFATHDPTSLNRQGNDIGTQYRSAIFVISDEQQEIARALISELGEKAVFPGAIVTQLVRASTFWPAEKEHWSYFARHGDVPYCQYVIAPKVAKFREKFTHLRRRPAK